VLNQMIGFTENLRVRLSLAGNARLVANALTLYAAALREPSARYHEQMRQHPGLLGQDGTPLKETPAELREVFGRLASVNQRLMQALVSLQVYGNDPDVRYALQKMADLAAE
jgi:hypothetical protein